MGNAENVFGEFGVVKGEIAFDDFAKDSLAEDDVIVPEAEGVLDAFEEGGDFLGERQAVGFGHFEGVAEGFSGDAPGVGIVLAEGGGLFGEGVELEMDGFGEEIFDGVAGLADFLADAPP